MSSELIELTAKWYKARLMACATKMNTKECTDAFSALGKAENDLSEYVRLHIAGIAQ